MAERRNFSRIDMMVPVESKIVFKDFANPGFPPNVFYTKNISGGGMLLLSPKPIDSGTKLELTLDIEEDEKTIKIDALGQVLNSIGKTSDGKIVYEVKVKFADIDEGLRDKLVGFILKKQAKQSRQQKLNTKKNK